MNKKIRAQIFVSGRVQGVFFRASSRTQAEDLGLVGWIKNLEDDRVEIILEGEKEKVDEFIKWLKRGGPLLAKINKTEINFKEPTNEFESFEIKFD
jgi:acylphosphatase